MLSICSATERSSQGGHESMQCGRQGRADVRLEQDDGLDAEGQVVFRA